MNKLKQRMRSDRAASVSVETIIIIALAVFAGLALFTYVLRPVQNSANNLGTGIDNFTGDLMDSQGVDLPTFNGGTRAPSPAPGSGGGGQ